MSSDESPAFDWADVDVAVPEQAAISVYLNPAGEIVLRQRGDYFIQDDACIWLQVQHAVTVAKAILEAAGLDAGALAPEPIQAGNKPSDPTAAGRQARYRERQKNKPAPEPDIFGRNDHNAVTPEDRSRPGISRIGPT